MVYVPTTYQISPLSCHYYASSSYIRRCDGNSIQPGLEYSLYYWDNNNWQLINTKIANDVFIEFENVPQKALLAIKCSQGKQQRIFVCDEDNKIDWY